MSSEKPEENQLLTKNLVEAQEVALFLESPAWAWLKKRLEDVIPRLTIYATAPGKARDDRMLALGKLALIQEILTRPAILSDLKRSYEARLDAEPMQVAREPGGGYGNPGIL